VRFAGTGQSSSGGNIFKTRPAPRRADTPRLHAPPCSPARTCALCCYRAKMQLLVACLTSRRTGVCSPTTTAHSFPMISSMLPHHPAYLQHHAVCHTDKLEFFRLQHGKAATYFLNLPTFSPWFTFEMMVLESSGCQWCRSRSRPLRANFSIFHFVHKYSLK
jgi:hypothetical protein